MKKQLIILAFAVSNFTYGQSFFNGTASPSSAIYRSGRTGFGMTSAPSNFKIEVETPTSDDGISIKQTSQGNVGLYLNNAYTGGHNWGLFSMNNFSSPGGGHFGIYDNTTAAYRFFIDGSSGNVGIGTLSPSEILSVSSSALNDGISVTQTGTSSSALHLYNSSSGGNHWGAFSTGSGSSQGAGNFSIYDYGASADRFFIKGSTGYVGIGTNAPTFKLHVVSDDAGMTNNPMQLNSVTFEPTGGASSYSFIATSKYGIHAAVKGYDLNNNSNSNGYLNQGIGFFGEVVRTTASGFGTNSMNLGVVGLATGSDYDIGAVFWGDGGEQDVSRMASNSNGSTETGFGVWASSANGIAGYFNGSSYSTSFYQSGDAIIKNEISPLTEAIDKIKLLKPNNFTFKTSEFANLNLPSGKQMGLDAEDVQKVFPELVIEIKDVSLLIKTRKPNDVKTLKAINYTNLIPVLIAGVQEQQKQIDDQTKANSDLKNLVAIQQQQINDLLTKSTDPTGMKQFNNLGDGFSMDQNIPNPFSQETVIKYNLPQQITTAYMVVYDLSGKQIASFPLTQKGTASIAITSEKLIPGIYIYSIVADGKVMDSKRMIVAEKQ